MKIWTDRKGNVHSFGQGSIEKQQAELIAIMAYIQRRVVTSETIVAQSDGMFAENQKAKATAIRNEYADM